MLTGYMDCESLPRHLPYLIYINAPSYPTSVVINPYDATMWNRLITWLTKLPLYQPYQM